MARNSGNGLTLRNLKLPRQWDIQQSKMMKCKKWWRRSEQIMKLVANTLSCMCCNCVCLCLMIAWIACSLSANIIRLFGTLICCCICDGPPLLGNVCSRSNGWPKWPPSPNVFRYRSVLLTVNSEEDTSLERLIGEIFRSQKTFRSQKKIRDVKQTS